MNDHLYLDIEKRARKRWKALYEDGMKTEFDRIEEFKTKLCKEFKFSKDKLVDIMEEFGGTTEDLYFHIADLQGCLLYTSPSPRDRQKSRMPSSA